MSIAWFRHRLLKCHAFMCWYHAKYINIPNNVKRRISLNCILWLQCSFSLCMLCNTYGGPEVRTLWIILCLFEPNVIGGVTKELSAIWGGAFVIKSTILPSNIQTSLWQLVSPPLSITYRSTPFPFLCSAPPVIITSRLDGIKHPYMHVHVQFYDIL